MGELKARWRKERAPKETFVGRRAQVDVFEKLYDTLDEREATVLNYYGVGGIGKTTLLGEIEKVAVEKGVPVFRYDLSRHLSTLSFYEALCSWLAESALPAVYLPMAFMLYWRRHNPNVEFKESMPAVLGESGLFGDIAAATMDSAHEIAKEVVPIVGGMAKILYKGYRKLIDLYRLDEEIVAEIRELETEDLARIETMLPYFFMRDLERIARKETHPPLFLFDTYERLYEAVSYERRYETEAWIENFAAGVQERGMLVVAGREALRWERYDSAWQGLIVGRRLDALSLEESRRLVHALGVKEERVTEGIVEASEGYPFYIELAVEAYRSAPEELAEADFSTLGLEGIFRRFVGNLGSEHLAILEYLSVPRSFDEKLYRHLMRSVGAIDSGILFEHVTAHSFFLYDDGRYTMHELMRRSFEKRLGAERVADIDAVIFDFYHHRSGLESGEDTIDTTILREASYHLLRFADTEKILEWFSLVKRRLFRRGAFHLLAELYEEAVTKLGKETLKTRFLVELSLLHLELDEYEKLKEKLAELEYSVVPVELLDDVDFLKAKKELFRLENRSAAKKGKNAKRWDPTHEVVRQLERVVLKSDSPELRMRASIELSNIARKNGDFFSAQSRLFSVLPLASDELHKAKVHDKLGYLYRDMRRPEESRRQFLEAIALKSAMLAKEHVELGKSYRGLSHALLAADETDRGCEAILEAVGRFVRFYGKWSKPVWAEYLRLVRYKDTAWARKQEAVDMELFLLAAIREALQEGRESSGLLEELEALDGEVTDRYLKLAAIYLNREERKAAECFEKAYKAATSDVEKRRVFLYAFRTYSRRRRTSEAQEFLGKMLEVSSRMGWRRYVGDWQRAAVFYTGIRQYDQAEAAYEQAVAVAGDRYDGKRKMAEILRYHSRLCQKRGDASKAVALLEREAQVWAQLEMPIARADALREMIKLFRQKGKREEAARYCQEAVALYESVSDFGRADTIYGMLAEIYARAGDKEEALHCYLHQIELRKRLGDVLKLAKGYKFLADFVYREMEEVEEAERFLRAGLEVLKEGKAPHEAIHLHSFHLLKFYSARGEMEKLETIIRFRIENAEASGVLHFRLLALEDLANFQIRLEREEEAEKTLERMLSLVPQTRYPMERHGILKRLADLSQSKNPDRAAVYRLQMYQIDLATKRYREADQGLDRLFGMLAKVDAKVFQMHYHMVFGNLLRMKSYRGYAVAMRRYRDYAPSDRWRFAIDQVRRLRKQVRKDPTPFFAVSKTLEEAGAYGEAALFYEAGFEAMLGRFSGDLGAQSALYEEALKRLKRLNNQVVTRRFMEQYDRFRNRLARVWIVNGAVVDRGLEAVLEGCPVCPEGVSVREVEEVLGEFVRRCAEDKTLSERVDSNRLASSVLIQGVRVLVPGYDPLRFGFEGNEVFLRWVLAGSPLRLIKAKNRGGAMVQRRSRETPEDFEPLEDIEDYDAFVHEKSNYAILLSRAFFEGDGLFFPKNAEFGAKVYRFFALNSPKVLQMTFTQIVEWVWESFNIDGEVDRVRVENLVMNLYYAGLFLSDRPFDDFENRRFTLVAGGYELEERLKVYGRERLEKLIGRVEPLVYHSLWV